MKDEIILQKLHRVNIAFAVSEKIVSPERLEKGKKTNKQTYVWFTQSLADSVFCHC